MRLDSYLFEKGFAQSRNKAAELIKEGSVWLNGKVERKNSAEVGENDTIEVEKIAQYVSRAGLKLRGFINELALNVKDADVLDIGSSTGGFTQVLLENEVLKVTCVDVGSNQLHERIKHHPKITFFENTDIRNFQSEDIFEIVTCDVSFISILNILNDINRLASKDIIILFKPQFEVGTNVKRDKKGVVKDKNAIIKARQKFVDSTLALNWNLKYSNLSRLQGKDGNEEELFYFNK